jgi:DNA-binding NarL/FixJ family response regulator
MTGQPIRVILADDHALVVEGLRSLIEATPDIEVVATAHTGEDVLQLLEQHFVDVVVTDIQMPGGGLEVIRTIRDRRLEVRILVLTAFTDAEMIQTAIDAQADGYALKTESPTQTIEAIRQVAQGRLVFPRAVRNWLSVERKLPNEPLNPVLSPREKEILGLAATGKSNGEIARELTVSENTVRFHMKNIFEKLNVTNRTEAAAWFFQNHNEKNL